LALPAVEAFGGLFLTRSTSQIQPDEAGLPLRTILVEFDSYEKALAVRQSEAHMKALRLSDLARYAISASWKAHKEGLVGRSGI
jgi:uncharacterized protein (DUF1330 family)